MKQEKTKSLSDFFRGYGYILGVGIILFGVFAVFFQTYTHPLYGFINFGEYHVLIGVTSIIIGAIVIIYLKKGAKAGQ
jgi:cyanate permease